MSGVGARGKHAAIVDARYIDLMLSGRKTIEARLSVCRIPPMGAVFAGDVIYLRARGGAGFTAVAVAGRVWSFEGLSARGVRGLAREFGVGVCAPEEFWRARGRAHYATLIELESVREIEGGPTLVRRAGDRRAWFVLEARRRAA